jgi:hypothetical protein
MRRLLILILFVLVYSFVLANPIAPTFISEIYFDEDDAWTLELCDYFGMLDYQNINGFELSCESGSAIIYEDIYMYQGTTTQITADNLYPSLSIDRTGDFVKLEGEYYIDVIYFGDHITSHVNYPFTGQSLGRIAFTSAPPSPSEVFRLAKENQPSIGSNPFSVNTLGILSGYVYDIHSNPVSNAQIHYSPSSWGSEFCTNEEGYFENEVYGMNYTVTVKINDYNFGTTETTIEPDSTTFIEFYTVYDPIQASNEELQFTNYELRNHPNPFNPSTTIYFETTNLHENTRIDIYNSKGQIVKQLRITDYELRNGEVVWNAEEFASGVYYYKLISDNEELASSKMLLLK